jgi:hypothetical protein
METDQIAVFIPIVAIIMGIGIGMLSLYLNYRKKRDIYELHHKERMAAIEKGMELPPLPMEFFRDGRDLGKRSPEGRLRSGLVMLLVGGAIAFALYNSHNGSHDSWVWGLVPAAVGVANLIVWAAMRNKPEHGGDTPPAPRA